VASSWANASYQSYRSGSNHSRTTHGISFPTALPSHRVSVAGGLKHQESTEGPGGDQLLSQLMGLDEAPLTLVPQKAGGAPLGLTVWGQLLWHSVFFGSVGFFFILVIAGVSRFFPF